MPSRLLRTRLDHPGCRGWPRVSCRCPCPFLATDPATRDRQAVQFKPGTQPPKFLQIQSQCPLRRCETREAGALRDLSAPSAIDRAKPREALSTSAVPNSSGRDSAPAAPPQKPHDPVSEARSVADRPARGSSGGAFGCKWVQMQMVAGDQLPSRFWRGAPLVRVAGVRRRVGERMRLVATTANSLSPESL
jgi:hypothetical protein